LKLHIDRRRFCISVNGPTLFSMPLHLSAPCFRAPCVNVRVQSSGYPRAIIWLSSVNHLAIIRCFFGPLGSVLQRKKTSPVYMETGPRIGDKAVSAIKKKRHSAGASSPYRSMTQEWWDFAGHLFHSVVKLVAKRAIRRWRVACAAPAAGREGNFHEGRPGCQRCRFWLGVFGTPSPRASASTSFAATSS
jgi:hypothetical protein